MSLLSVSCFLAILLPWIPGGVGSPFFPSPQHSSQQGVGRAVYLITNDEKANAVIALPIGADGKLCPGTATLTGGTGSVALDSDEQPATPDALVSQSALTIAGNVSEPSLASPTIFAVNTGSNTLSMLSISAADPTKLSLAGKPVPVPGEFPTTVAASAKHHIVCVGTTGAKAGIACSRFTTCGGLSPMDALRPFDLGQTTPPVGPTNTVSQVFFSADESMLFATVKGDPASNNTGFFSAFSVQRANAPRHHHSSSSSRGPMSAVSRIEQRSFPNNTAVLFGSQPIPGSPTNHHVFATDASFGAAILSVDPATGRASTIATGEIAGQKATCWATISPATGTAFVTDVAVNRLVEMDVRDARVLSQLDLSAAGSPDPGLIDLRAAGGFIYALSPGNGTTEAAVSVVSVGGGSAKMVQRFGLGSMGVGRNAMGMAVLI
ncbi:uncharacterized protein B0T15DRAFT_388436 [Chaetomium strumarium]|uniref:3-carboxymuconate cyclase n=1 Tax=Chaetomium strumarium TaxID=1170767 RepID=A0AAJ0H3J9_9PEZI|nr:hypothetical protein B0T15DRAFT_388436 [Chaetomium strumarium]